MGRTRAEIWQAMTRAMDECNTAHGVGDAAGAVRAFTKWRRLWAKYQRTVVAAPGRATPTEEKENG